MRQTIKQIKDFLFDFDNDDSITDMLKELQLELQNLKTHILYLDTLQGRKDDSNQDRTS